MFDLTSAKDGDDSGTPVVLQCTLPFLNLLHSAAVVMMTMLLMKRRLQWMTMMMKKMMQNLVNEILEGKHLNLGP